MTVESSWLNHIANVHVFVCVTMLISVHLFVYLCPCTCFCVCVYVLHLLGKTCPVKLHPYLASYWWILGTCSTIYLWDCSLPVSASGVDGITGLDMCLIEPHLKVPISHLPTLLQWALSLQEMNRGRGCKGDDTSKPENLMGLPPL